MQENSNLSVLVVDPNPGMRGSLQAMLNQVGISKIEYAVNSSTAMRQLMRKSYDVILCEYDLGSSSGDGQDGQQLLEDLRHHRLIGMWTIFIMLTSEAVYSKVVSAAELTPTDYILKPFTVDMLSGRITRALERRKVFLPTYQLIGQGNLREAIRSCEQAEQAQPRYATEFARLRAELHLELKEHEQAEALYRTVLETRPLGWASLGLARSMQAQGRIDEARDMLERLVLVNPRLMAAYDLLARCHEAAGDLTQSQKVLEEAVGISPHMVRRLRKLGEVALEAGDVNAAERSFKQVVSKARYSEFRDPEDHVRLVRTLVKKGDATQAAGIVRDLDRSMRGNANVDACKAISNSLLHELAGNKAAMVADLHAAVGAVRSSSGLSAGLKIDLAQSCLANQLDQQASEVMLAVMNDTESGVSAQQAMAVFVKAGRDDLAEGMGRQLKAQAQVLLGVADEKRNMGDVRGAVQTLLEALHIAPKNLQVMIAVVGGILRQINEMGWDHPLAELCAAQLENIRSVDAGHPRLAALEDEFTGAKRKYGISA
ncbi:response regulator [Massilia horti]|uniref:Response regulator n=2 Tax=Massilia horti TaxID=2562153 RepID=A0A4Y9STY9_9BURK|nr:response regulator [Massilia horti]